MKRNTLVFGRRECETEVDFRQDLAEPLTCTEALRVLKQDLDAIGPGALRAELTAHLESCRSCRTEAETQLAVRLVLKHRPEDALPHGFSERLAERLDLESRARSAARAFTTPVLTEPSAD